MSLSFQRLAADHCFLQPEWDGEYKQFQGIAAGIGTRHRAGCCDHAVYHRYPCSMPTAPR